jgi:leucyl/phenylalanyl-tRNA--protein transferase
MTRPLEKFTAEHLIKAYALGIFPMAESADAETLFWVDPEYRGILPLDGFHIPARLARTVRQDVFDVHVDLDFPGMMRACAKSRAERPSTWINDEIISLYTELHERGLAHSVECWKDRYLAGGLYGVALGGAFFGESMVSFERDASKVALVHLIARLKAGNYSLLDTQFVTDHLRRFGAIEIPKERYHKLLEKALTTPADFFALPRQVAGQRVLQSITQRS